jgi:flagellin-like hook-associated protein FlgL
VKLPSQLVTNYGLSRTTLSIARAAERPSEFTTIGQSITKKRSDATLISLREGLTSDSRIYSTAIQNVNSGVSLVNRTEQALAAIEELASKIKVLADQAARTNTTNETRVLLDGEAQSLVSQINEIVTKSRFSNVELFTASTGTQTKIQAGLDSKATLTYNSVNQDSLLDAEIMTTTPATPDATIGDGNFTSLGNVSNPGASTVVDVLLADMNNDGRLDLVTSDLTTVGIQLGNGDGTFSVARSTFALPKAPNGGGMVIEDFNNDGNLDVLAIAEGYDTGVTDNIILGYGDGGGGFSSSSTVVNVVADDTHELTVTDLNGDGNRDILTVGTLSSEDVLIFYGTGAGTFNNTPQQLDTLTNVRNVVAADFNGDSLVDLAYSGDVAGEESFGIFFGTGAGTFNATAVEYDTTASGGRIQVADFDGDNDVDIVSLRRDNGSTTQLTFWLNDGAGGMTLDDTKNLGGGFSDPRGSTIRIADLEGDGDTDVVFANTGNSAVGVAINDGSGSFSAVNYTSGPETTSVAVGDINEDNILDIVSANYNNDTISRFTQGSTIIPGSPGGVELTILSLSSVDLTSQDSAATSSQYASTLISQIQSEASIQNRQKERYATEANLLRQTGTINRRAASGLTSLADATSLSLRIQDNILESYLQGVAAQTNKLTEKSGRLLKE